MHSIKNIFGRGVFFQAFGMVAGGMHSYRGEDKGIRRRKPEVGIAAGRPGAEPQAGIAERPSVSLALGRLRFLPAAAG